MNSKKQSIFSYCYFYCYYCIIILLIYVAKNEAQSSNRTIYSFGDSYVDPGNNNYILTLARSNFPPYGRDFINRVPTGRFTNGRQIPDFIAALLNTTNLPRAYLDPLLSQQDLRNPVGFGSASTGFDPLTPPILNVIPMTTQARNFRDYRGRLSATIGQTSANETVQNALVYVAAGTNDFIINYFNNPLRRIEFTVQRYQEFLIQLIREFLQDLLGQGVTRIAVLGLPPLGCLPIVITAYSNSITNSLTTRNCVESINVIARDFNTMLQQELTTIQSRFNGTRIVYNDYYGPVIDTIQNPDRYGFTVVNRGCCGTGTFEQGPLCNPLTITCPDATKYVFWDSVHFTETAFQIVFNANRQSIDSLVN